MENTNKAHFLSSKTVVIAGAGVAGLSLAIALAQQFPLEDVQTQRPRILVYERDSEADRIAGRQGYSLSLRTDSDPGGIQVLERLGLYKRIRSVSVNAHDSEADRGCFNIWDQDFNPVLRIHGRPVGPKGLLGMRVGRGALQCELAAAAVEAGAEIHWSTAVIGVKPLLGTGTTPPVGQVEISLSDGAAVVADLLIAADGSSSKIRSLLLPSHGLDYTGIYLWGGTGVFAERTQIPRPVDRDWGAVLGGQGIGLFVSPIDSTSALWSMSRASPTPQPSLRHPLTQDQIDAMIDESIQLSARFHPLVRDLVQVSDPSSLIQLNAMDRPPFAHDVGALGPVVWIGDANHAVSPFAGNGANMALMDAWDLAECLKCAATLQDAIVAYDARVLPRGNGVLKASRWTIDISHASGWKFWLYRYALWVVSLFVRVPV
ncbi:hypothetical protein LTR84_009743 [Exophiala bonariae]|uniref:FAD-binding domain-containing protein n=1 Tax=Exophiala bonariae TaxID=1690606 RepID=A0AAV9NLP5_9EURO|nr:hypothetical protein LTR84_009743 [Exophiala bonariae]